MTPDQIAEEIVSEYLATRFSGTDMSGAFAVGWLIWKVIDEARRKS